MTSKRYALLFLILLIAVGGLLWLKQRPEVTQGNEDQQNFAVSNPDEVSLIFMTDQSGDKQIYLRKQPDGTWTVNNSFVASEKRVNFLLNETMSNLKVQGPAPKAAVENVLSYMSIHGIKVEVYTSNPSAPELVYMVGNTTPSQLGTYYKLPGDNLPMIVQIPGFNGFLNSRYDLNEDVWISRALFASNKDQIKSIKVSYPDSLQSFGMTKKPDGNIDFTASLEAVNTGAVKSYFNLFGKLNFETFYNTTSDSLKNALKAKQPFCTIRLESENRGVDELAFYQKESHEKMHGLYDKEGNELAHDPSRFYALSNKFKRVLIVQDYTFGKVLQTAKDFSLRTQ
ncbi:MAG: hypothetical protein JJ975_03170 [Bacteroidia bacterium]|nr:hypothetical protein [Bacteroidia bacterium]